MTTNILEMRGITKTFPGVKALSNVTLGVERGEVHAICGENGAGKSTLMKVLSGVYPHGTYDGDIVFEDETVEFQDLRDSEAKGIVIIHQELALSPYLSIAENIFLNNELQGPRRPDRLEQDQLRGGQAPRPRRPAREPDDEDQGHRRRQAAARRDREGALEGGEAPHPRRADRRAQRRGLRSPARPDPAPQGAGDHVDHHQPQAERDQEGRRLGHGHPRRQDDRDDRQGGCHRRPHHQGHGRPRPRAPLPRPHAAHRRGAAARRGLDRTPPAGPVARDGRQRQPQRARRRDRRHRRASWAPDAPSSR